MFTQFRLVRMSILWAMTALIFCLHETYDVANIQFGIDVKQPDANGAIPAMKHVLRLLYDAGSMLIALLILYVQPRWFRWTLLVWLGITVLANVLHIIAIVKEDPHHYSQIGIIVLALVISVFLFIDNYKWVKETKDNEPAG
jgi:hypothetical protein